MPNACTSATASADQLRTSAASGAMAGRTYAIRSSASAIAARRPRRPSRRSAASAAATSRLAAMIGSLVAGTAGRRAMPSRPGESGPVNALASALALGPGNLDQAPAG